MLIADLHHFPTWASLAVVLAVAIVASLRADRLSPLESASAPGENDAR